MTDLIYNKQGKLTRKAKPREIVPAVEQKPDFIDDFAVFVIAISCKLWYM